MLYRNRFSGVIPKEFGELTKLELLDLRENDLSGTVPAEIGEMPSLKCLYVHFIYLFKLVHNVYILYVSFNLIFLLP